MFKNLLLALVTIVFMMSCSKKATQAKAATEIEEVVVKPLNRPMSKDSFPFTWFGTWTGTLEIYNSKGTKQTTPMEMIIGPTDTAGVYKWHIIYGPDREKGLRPYLLRTIDASKGLYVNDEMNSIKMEAYYLGGKLFCNFAVEGNLLTTIEEKVGNTLKFDIVFGKEKPVSITGNQVIKGDTIPAVKTMPVLIHQKAVLTKQM